jgi:hypothetical protein
VARGVSAANKYVQSAELNGQPLNKPWVYTQRPHQGRHADSRNGIADEPILGQVALRRRELLALAPFNRSAQSGHTIVLSRAASPSGSNARRTNSKRFMFEMTGARLPLVDDRHDVEGSDAVGRAERGGGTVARSRPWVKLGDEGFVLRAGRAYHF